MEDEKKPDQLRGLMDCVERKVVTGLRHGYFEILIRCETTSRGMRRVIVRAGRSYKFNVQENEVAR
ncbi:hypothetical protein [Allomesorhizobium camelthorni]|uniref:Uncharacterized protein n=1 Tax=Allomesorhizobium camelthorni TaxID=475069 RepID=A0A6G4WFG2_9HYPH|nr:hypothetical protein [Mesorhizobium camelthorni]NGO52966.1 hypothetical protein [Mesorhizobium camelthorni]